MTAGGCTMIAWTVNALMPPEKIDAVYELPETGKILVLLDDRGKPVRYEKIKRLLTEKINRLLLENNVAEKVVSYDDVFRLGSTRQDFHNMGVSDIARKLGATQTIYVYLDEFSLKEAPGTNLWEGKLGTLVRVVSDEGKTVWPDERPVGHRPPIAKTPQTVNASPTYGETVAIELANNMADKIAKLFYVHYVPRGHTGGKN
jgi:hypothetical protein